MTGGSNTKGKIPRYELSVVDRTGGPARGAASVGVVLVHPSRFQDFEFAKEEGQQQVADSTGYGRLVFVRLHPSHQFDLGNGMAAVQTELSALVKPLFPAISELKREKVRVHTIVGCVCARERQRETERDRERQRERKFSRAILMMPGLLF